MNITVKKESAVTLSQNIESKGEIFTNFAQAAVAGGNTAGIGRAAALGARTQHLFSRYRAVVARDGQQVTVLAQHFEELDKDMGNQIQGCA